MMRLQPQMRGDAPVGSSQDGQFWRDCAAVPPQTDGHPLYSHALVASRVVGRDFGRMDVSIAPAGLLAVR
jgi:hypothetical protein